MRVYSSNAGPATFPHPGHAVQLVKHIGVAVMEADLQENLWVNKFGHGQCSGHAHAHSRAVHTLTFPRAMSLWITVAKAYSVAAANEARAPALWLKMYSWRGGKMGRGSHRRKDGPGRWPPEIRDPKLGRQGRRWGKSLP